MYTLGLEGTAHTISASVLDEEKIYSLASMTYSPEQGGINPREAAEFHFKNIKGIIERALRESGIGMDKIGLISFSRGPGLPPSLKIVATAARALSIKYNIPIVGVNHPLGHIEIGRRETGAVDPVMLYVSGGNTQIIAYRNGKYRVFGETLDIGIGNLLDKVARQMGFPFPGGPAIERLALNGGKLLQLPYTVRGMDTAFSGMYTACVDLMKKGERNEDICMSLQEYAFSMLVETLERAIFTTGKKSILLAGGVARNKRLREMIKIMADEAGVEVFETPDKYCMDNGAMIGQAGILTFKARGGDNLEDTAIDQFYRIDQAFASWVQIDERKYENRGAESDITYEKFHSFDAVKKARIPKGYRLKELDHAIRKARMRREITMLYRLSQANVPVPEIFAVDVENASFSMERIEGVQLSMMIEPDMGIGEKLGRAVGKMHSSSLCHGDLTMNNILVADNEIVIIDPSMGNPSGNIQDFAYDMRLLRESVNATIHDGNRFMSHVEKAYRETFHDAGRVLEEVKNIEARRRYV